MILSVEVKYAINRQCMSGLESINYAGTCLDELDISFFLLRGSKIITK